MDKLALKILLVINSGKDVSPFRFKGYSPSQIVDQLKKMIDLGYIVMLEDGFNITESGIMEIDGINNSLGNKNSGRRISLEIESQIPKLGELEVYIPREGEITFD